MIGKYVRNLQHLKDSVGEKTICKGLIIQNSYPCYFEIVHTQKDGILIFNGGYGNIKFNISKYSSDPNYERIVNTYSKYRNVIALNNDENVSWFIDSRFSLIVFPDNFDEEYASFIKNNNKQIVNNITNKYGCNTTHAVLLLLYCYCNNSINFLVWAAKNVYGNKVPIPTILYVLNWNNEYSQCSNKLANGTITAYNGLNSVLRLIGELNVIRKNKIANDSIMQFNTNQKKLLKDNFSNSNYADILSKFGKLSETKRLNFIRKMSTIDDLSVLIHDMSLLCEMHFSWNKESFISYLESVKNLSYDKVIDKDNIVLLKVKDYETIKKLAKNTNWCISKNKRYWNDYVENYEDSEQYVLFDFSKKEDDDLSIVGFTVKNGKNITHAHSFTNNNIMGRQANCNLKSFINLNPNNIYQILSDNNIPKSIFSKRIPNPFEWNEDSLTKRLIQSFGKKFIKISEKDNKVAFLIKGDSRNYESFFTRDILRRFGDYGCFISNEVIMFVDFNKDESDEKSVMYAYVQNSGEGEETGSNCYNSQLDYTNISMDEMFIEFGIPYDFIKRKDNITNRFISYVHNYNVRMMDNLLKCGNFKSSFKKNKNSGQIFTNFYRSIFNYHSFEMFDTIYNNGVRMTDIMQESDICEIVNNLFNNILSYSCTLNSKLPKDHDINNLYNGRINSSEVCIYIGSFILMDKIFNNEDNKHIYLTLLRYILRSVSNCNDVIIYFIEKCLDKIKGNKLLTKDDYSFIFNFSKRYNLPTVLAKIEAMKDEYSFLNDAKVFFEEFHNSC